MENVPDEKIEIEGQNILKKLVMRRLSNFVGQGAFNFASQNSYITEVIKIPQINISGLLHNQVKIKLDIKEDNANFTQWAEFSNGVASGLKLSKELFQINPENIKTWIFYQKPDNLDFEHGGFLLGVGLLGYLDSFSPTDIFQYLKQNHEATCVGILLGIAASRIGRPDESTAKTLCLHIPFLLPPSYDVDIPLNVQTSALVGIGLLNLGNCNRLITEMAIAQIGRKPNSDKCLDREGYSLAAGFSLGLVNLGQGSQHPNIKDLDLEERLIRFIEGGKKMNQPESMLSSNFNTESKCSSIRENHIVNVHVTGQGALLALGLINLKSNNQLIADKISIPNSFAMIENCNPNHILLKTAVRNIIMWDNIQNTPEFIYSQIPKLIKFIYEQPFSQVYEHYYLVYNVDEIDFATVTQIYNSIIGGCIMAMGLKYAGTGDQKASDTIYNEIEKMRRRKTTQNDLSNDPNNKNSIDQYSLFTLLSVSLLSLSLIKAGTSDVSCLKLCRVIRKKFQDQGVFHYGFNMAIHLAIGFLCLGRGQQSFKRDNLSIASLLITIYPYFPNSPNDNKNHLQALRHFYVLATEQKVFFSVDVDSGQQVNVQVQIEMEVNSQIIVEKLNTPILMQDSKKIISVKVVDEDYYDTLIFVKQQSNKNPRAIYVKRRDQGKYLHYQVVQQNDIEFQQKNEELFKKKNQYFKMLSFINCSEQKIDKRFLKYLISFSYKNGHNINFDNLYNNRNQLCQYIDNEQRKMARIQNDNQKVLWNYYHLLKDDRISFLNIFLFINKKIEWWVNQDPQQLNQVLKLCNFYQNSHLYTIFELESSIFFNSQQINIVLESIQQKFYSQLKNHDNDQLMFIQDQYLQKNLYSVLDIINWKQFRSFEQFLKIFLICDAPQKQQLDQTVSLFKILKQASSQQLFENIYMILFLNYPNSYGRIVKYLAQYFENKNL